MIDDKAVEAAFQAMHVNASRPSMEIARAALQAALPVLLEGKAEEIARVIREGLSAPGYSDPAMKLAHEHDIDITANRIISIFDGRER